MHIHGTLGGIDQRDERSYVDSSESVVHDEYSGMERDSILPDTLREQLALSHAEKANAQLRLEMNRGGSRDLERRRFLQGPRTIGLVARDFE